MENGIERRNQGAGLGGILVNPGEIAVVEDGTPLLTIVSTGVAVCLWEPDRKVAGLAHFYESIVRDSTRATARYGSVAVPHMVSLVRRWSPESACEAQIYGGAELKHDDNRGRENVALAQRLLERLRVPVVSQDVGGSKGRKLVFDSRNGNVGVVKVHALRDTDCKA